nr:beta-propeller domain-containing protein [Opitutaceae bacterium]
MASAIMPANAQPRTRIELIDPATLESKSELTVDGYLNTARTVEGDVRLVVATAGPTFDFEQPENPNSVESLTAADAANRKIINDSKLEDWIPTGWLGEDRETMCRGFGVPAEFSGFSMLGIAGVEIKDGQLSQRSMAGVAADSGSVYASADHLYVATSRWQWESFAAVENGDAGEGGSTEIHRFNISDVAATKYEGSGSVVGTLLNSYSMDEYKDVLRVATTAETWNQQESTSESHLTTLRLEGSELLAIGRVSGLGKGETIQSARFVGDRGYVVTFRQTDPLYVLDLSDPADPKVSGELKVTGFSEYLHPVGEHRILGVGPEADNEGRVTGYQASMFDVSDPAAPKQLSRIQLSSGSGGGSLQYDPHAFLFWAKSNIAVLPVSGYAPSQACPQDAFCDSYVPETYSSRAVVIGLGDELREQARISHETDLNTDAYRTQITRSLVIGDYLYTVSSRGLAQSNMADWATSDYVLFPEVAPFDDSYPRPRPEIAE